MNENYLQSKFKSSGTAYLCWFFLGCHYAYIGKWGYQILYWVTIGGLGIWMFVDLFHIPTKIDQYNLRLSSQFNR